MDMLFIKTEKPKLLLHACCAPCAVVPLKRLITDYEIVLYFYNPNIDTAEEYEKRARELYKAARYFGLDEKNIITGKYEKEDFFKETLDLKNEKEGGARCVKCFYLRLNSAAKKAKELNIPYFTTSLTTCPHKNAESVNSAGRQAAQNTGATEFLEFDFKKKDGFKESLIICREADIYRQSYCGCVYSRTP